MNIKTALYVIFLSTFATLQCTDKEQLRVELAAKEEQLKKLGEEIEKQEALYEYAKKRCLELQELFLEERKRANAKRTKHQKSDDEIFDQTCNEIMVFIEKYYNSDPSENCMLNKEFFGDFSQHMLLKFYTIKMSLEYRSLETLISQWEKCNREAISIQIRLSA